ncbi:HD domain-containing protein [Anaerovorax odorimutans]|uniref:HD domain-containing protein n=1 Tax=Anaerovorax odorimutans TaxID=109327 RepID=A0ABT1RKP1_9FIRM|nr:HD domain-containing protein [Anaerovorax odorimutans]MCQ4635747.1 HD domain-containing protein [Anaerovorax odorimutans]
MLHSDTNVHSKYSGHAGPIAVPREAAYLINRLTACGYEAFAVGGCVRDSLLGKTPNDWDICTSALPDDMKQCFSGLPVIETGIKHGTLTVVLEHRPFEITTYRIDGEYRDGRHPEQVRFTSDLQADLSRRDFTINAMAYHPGTGLVDPFGGLQDLQAGIIRCVGDAPRRFEEDALRIMRGIRFAAQLGFDIEGKTAGALLDSRELLDRISSERIRTEFDKLLCGSGAMDVLAGYRDIVAQIIPEARPMFDLDQQNDYHIYTVWDHTLHVIDQIKNTPELKLCAFFHDIGKPEMMTVTEDGWGHFYRHELASERIADTVLARLKYDNRTRETVTSVVRNHSIVFRPSAKQARKLLHKLGEEKLRLLIQLEYADVKSQNPIYTESRVSTIGAFSQKVDEVLASENCFSLRDLAIGGRDLLDLGAAQGPEIGKILNTLLDMVMEDELPNQRDALLDTAIKTFGLHTHTEDTGGRTS